MYWRMKLRAKQPRREMCVAIAGEQSSLKENKARIPYAWCSSQVGKEKLGKHRLNAEEQYGIHEYSNHKQHGQVRDVGGRLRLNTLSAERIC